MLKLVERCDGNAPVRGKNYELGIGDIRGVAIW